MFSALRKQITPATILAFVALVFAITGGAFAATGGSGGGNPLAKTTASVASIHAVAAKSKPKTKAGPRGPAGPKGATGATGPAGPQGLAGAAGAKGESGAAGPTGPQGPEGQVGPKGETGPEGKPGTSGFTETLPSGKTLKGDWSVYGEVAEHVHVTNSVSFGIPLASTPVAHYIREDGKEPYFDEETEKEEQRKQPACPGNAAFPEAQPGNLCVYASDEENLVKEVSPYKLVLPAVCSLSEATLSTQGSACVKLGAGADKYGFAVDIVSESPGGEVRATQATGTWAVTAK